MKHLETNNLVEIVALIFAFAGILAWFSNGYYHTNYDIPDLVMLFSAVAVKGLLTYSIDSTQNSFKGEKPTGRR